MKNNYNSNRNKKKGKSKPAEMRSVSAITRLPGYKESSVISSELDDLTLFDDAMDMPAVPKKRFIYPKRLRQANANMANLERRRAQQSRHNKANMRRTTAKYNRQAATAFAVNSLSDSDLDRKGLWGCESVAAVETYIEKWNATFRRKATGALKRRKVDAMSSTCLEYLFDGTATSSPVMINKDVLREARQQLTVEMTAWAQANPNGEIAFVTIISGRGGTSHAKPDIDLFGAQAQAQSTFRAMSRHFFAVSELAIFNSHSHPSGGQLLQEHTHALVFGEGVLAKARAIALKHMDRYLPNVTNAPQIDVRSVAPDPVNIARICAYMFKAPARAMTWCPPRDGKKGHMHHSEKGDRKIRYLRMAMIRAMLTVDDVMFAGGEGNRIRSQIVKLVRAKCSASAPPHRRVLHPDAIGAFCVDLAAKLGKADWALPIIRRLK